MIARVLGLVTDRQMTQTCPKCQRPIHLVLTVLHWRSAKGMETGRVWQEQPKHECVTEDRSTIIGSLF